MGNDHLSIGRQKGRFKGFKHPKLFIYALYDVKGYFWLIFIPRLRKHTLRARRPERRGLRNIEIRQSL